MSRRPVAPPPYRPQPKPKVLQLKMAATQPANPPQRPQPVAPPVYKPQPVSKVLQRQVAGHQQPAKAGPVRVPVAPPVYQPQPLPHVLQLKRATVNNQIKSGEPRHPVAPPVYRPQPAPKVLQAKMNARPEPAHPHSRNERVTNLSQSKTGPGRSVIQRRIATRLALRGEELVKSEDAYQRSKNDPDRGPGIKPLLSIAIKDSDSRLHVHLVPDHLIRQMTGWNIKKREGGYEYSADLNCSMILDAEDRALFDTYAPRWKEQRAYPDKIVWNGRTLEEAEMLRQEQLALRREGYARKLEGKLESYVSKESTITETYVFAGPRARKKKGETASGYRRFIDKDKALPVVADVTITANVMPANKGENESLYRVKCVYAKGKYLAKKDQVKEAIEEFAKGLNVAGAAVVTDDWIEKSGVVRQARLAHIQDIRDGNQDDEMNREF